MNWELFISWRYLVAKRKERFISLVSLISILGIALGVMALIVVISVMNGFDRELREKFTGVNPHILIERQTGWLVGNTAQKRGIADPERLLGAISGTAHIVGASPFIDGQALFKANDAVTGVLLRGIEPYRELKVTKIEKYLVSGKIDLADTDIIVGSELAKRFYLRLGDEVSIISPTKGRTFNFKVAGIFDSGMYEYDLHLVFTDIKAAQEIFNLEGLVSGIGVRLDNLYKAAEVRTELRKKLDYSYSIRDWIGLRKSLFSALKLEKTVMFVIMALIVVVACFNIAGHLIMMVMEKNKDIGILKALGAKNSAIRKIFTLEGLLIGLSGTALGTASGIVLCHLLAVYKFISLPQDIYYIERLPVQMYWEDIIIIVVSALMITLLTTVYPAHQAARINPAETLRYE